MDAVFITSNAGFVSISTNVVKNKPWGLQKRRFHLKTRPSGFNPFERFKLDPLRLLWC